MIRETEKCFADVNICYNISTPNMCPAGQPV